MSASADGGDVQVGLGSDALHPGTGTPGADWVQDEGITARPIPLSTIGRMEVRWAISAAMVT